MSDEWKPLDKLNLSGFWRLEYLNIHGAAANNVGDFTGNTRRAGLNLASAEARLNHFSQNFLNGAFGLNVRYTLFGGFGLQADYTFTRVHRTIFNYGGHAYPSTDPKDTGLLRSGIFWNKPWIQLVSQITYINQTNNNSRSTFQHALERAVDDLPAGHIETVAWPIVYGISSWGWTTDLVLTPFKGFSLHSLLTLRDPQYKDFVFRPQFSDGVVGEYDFTGKNVTNLSKMEFEFDPSYTFDKWRIWLSVRYLSKQYVNKTNSLYFKGRWETFGGIDYTLNSHVKFNVNVINILNQKGASGNISSADLVEDPTPYKNYVMAGTFIRPFTVEFGTSINF